MSLNADEIFLAALALPSEERADLVDRLVENLDHMTDNPIASLWVQEVRRRHDEILSGKVKPIPGDVALASVRAAVGR